MTKHSFTVRAEIALKRAEAALAKAKLARDEAERKLIDCENDWEKAREDLFINQEIDATGKG